MRIVCSFRDEEWVFLKLFLQSLLESFLLQTFRAHITEPLLLQSLDRSLKEFVFAFRVKRLPFEELLIALELSLLVFELAHLILELSDLLLHLGLVGKRGPAEFLEIAYLLVLDPICVLGLLAKQPDHLFELALLLFDIVRVGLHVLVFLLGQHLVQLHVQVLEGLVQLTLEFIQQLHIRVVLAIRNRLLPHSRLTTRSLMRQ